MRNLPPLTRCLPVVLIILLVPLAGCNKSLLGAAGVKAIGHLDSTLGKSIDTTVGVIDKTQANVVQAFNDTRDAIFDFLINHSKKEAHDISVGILQGTIGYLDKPRNREALAEWLQTIIDSAVGPVRYQLITFRDQLLDPRATDKLRYLLQSIMQDLLLHPTSSLINIALGKNTRDQLDQMLRLLIPAVLNDSAITQIGKLRETLLGDSMRRDIAGLVDASLLAANRRLDSPIRSTIDKIVQDNTNTIKKEAEPIIIGLIILGLIIIWAMHQKIQLKNRMLTGVTMQIEKMNKVGDDLHNPKVYKDLTDSIADTMRQQDLEIKMNKFLKDRGIS